MVTLPPLLVSTDFGTCSYECFFSSCTPVSLHMLKCSCAFTLSCLFMYCSFASIVHADIMWSTVSSNCWQSLHLLSISVLNIFVAYYFVCNAWSCAANISLSVSAFSSPFDSQRNVSSSLISCLYIFRMYSQCITLFCHFLATLPILPLCVVFHPVLRNSSHLVDLILLLSLLLS